MSRVGKRDLEALARVLNNRLGRPGAGRTGNIYVGWANGGTRLHEVVEGGGERELSPRLSSGELAAHIRAMLIGIDLAEVNIKQAAPQLDGLPGWGEATHAS